MKKLVFFALLFLLSCTSNPSPKIVSHPFILLLCEDATSSGADRVETVTLTYANDTLTDGSKTYVAHTNDDKNVQCSYTLDLQKMWTSPPEADPACEQYRTNSITLPDKFPSISQASAYPNCPPRPPCAHDHVEPCVLKRF